jgi:predicted  nucleic acid-binding Zn-ribbon protein
MNIQCNWCMSVYLEDEDNLVIECLKCGTDSYLMELVEVTA